jgi:hypothetical protein
MSKDKNETPLFYIYTPGENGDAGLAQWYMVMVHSGDLQKTVGASMAPLSAFMREFTDPKTTLFYLPDDKGWWAVAWVTRMGTGGSYGVWIREDKRHAGSRTALAFVMSTLAASLAAFPVLLNVVKDPDVVEKTKRLGYAYLGCVPYLYDGGDAYLLYITREMYEPLFTAWAEKYGKD